MSFAFYSSGLGSICKDCEERHPACHDTCKRYLDAKEVWVNKKQMVKDAKEKAKMYDKYRVERTIKTRRSK